MSFQTKEATGIPYLTSTAMEGAGLIHGFSTRLGGVSPEPTDSLNFRITGPELDTPENIQENYRRFAVALGVDPEGLVLSNQVHEDTIRHVTRKDCGISPRPYQADALVTDEAGLSLMVFSADCTILLLYDPVTRSIGAVHAGWRGAALDLPRKTVQEMGRLFGTKPQNIRAAIGPGIGTCCFETGDDVTNALISAFGSGVSRFILPKEDKWTIDLKGLNGWRLWEAGVPSRNIDVCPLCTKCNPELFWSHRKHGEHRGLQGGLICLTEETRQ